MSPTPATPKTPAKTGLSLFLAAFFACLLFVLIRTAWLCDDAYITFRTVENLVSGMGPRWNVAERVQAFTHPLWMFVLAGTYYFTREVYFSSLILSICLTLAAFLVLVFSLAHSKWLALACGTVLLFSRSFIDYSTGGLENPLSHFLIVLFVIVYLREKRSLLTLFVMSLLASLGVLNRMDTLLLYLPALAFVWYERRSWTTVCVLAAGFLPFAAWEVFSVIYYGFPFPNTAYAKLGAGLTRTEHLTLGLYFYRYTWSHDPLTLPAIFLGLSAPFVIKRPRHMFLSAGIVLYLAYILWAGGVYMAGRLFTVPLMMAAAIFVSLPIESRPGAGIVAAVIAASLSLSRPYAPITTGAGFGLNVKRPVMDTNGIDDCRQSHYEWTGLLRWFQHRKPMPDCDWATSGRAYRASDRTQTRIHGATGFRGYLGGPKVHILDYYGLGDPLLARLPAAVPWWRTCHYKRVIPEGYVKTLKSQQQASSDALQPIANQITDPKLAEYFDHLILITRGPLFTAERFKTILLMNLGAYTPLIDQVAYRYPNRVHKKLAELSTPYDDGTAWNAPGTLNLNGKRLQIRLDRVTRDSRLEVSADHNDRYRIVFLKGQDIVGQRTLLPQPGRGLSVHKVDVPLWARIWGYTDLIIVPMGGDRNYSIGHVLLSA